MKNGNQKWTLRPQELTTHQQLHRHHMRQQGIATDDAEIAVHPAAELFPMMAKKDFESLKADIKTHGQKDPVIYWQKQLIDGRNRLKACEELGIKTLEADIPETEDPVAWVLSHNLHRRHLTIGQRAMVADKLATLRNGETKAATGIPVASQAEVAARLNVSVDSVQAARKVREEASPEVVERVERGELSLNAAVSTVDPKAKPKAKPKPLKILEIERSLVSFVTPKKEHHILDVCRSAFVLLSDQTRLDFLGSQLLKLSPEDMGKVYDDVEQRQQALTQGEVV